MCNVILCLSICYIKSPASYGAGDFTYGAVVQWFMFYVIQKHQQKQKPHKNAEPTQKHKTLI